MRCAIFRLIVKGVITAVIVLPLCSLASFEAIDCEQESVFENPVLSIKPGLQSIWVQAFGILPYTRVSYSARRLGVGVSNFGNNDYRENEILLGYSIMKANTVFGISARAMNLWINGYGSDFALGIDIGTNFQVTHSTNFYLTLSNINLPKISGEEIPSRVMGNFVINPSPDFKLTVSLYKESWYPTEVRLSNEIKLSALLSLMVGLKSYPQSFSFGILLYPGRFDISYNARTHPTLGLTHIFGLNMKTDILYEGL
ncbi:MAG: hypothetical protein QMD71_03120 [bacterium]|nr:hypothetical protein [bacterium]